MSTFDYAGMRATAIKLLTKFGNPVLLIRENIAPADYNPVGGDFDAKPDTDVNGVGVLVKYKNKEIDGDTIRATDRKLLFQGDEILINDKYNGFRVNDIDNIDPDESGTILTIANMRK